MTTSPDRATATVTTAGSPLPAGLDWSATAIAEAVRAGRVTAVDVVAESLRRIDERDPVLNAFQVVRRERALAEAADVDRRADRAALPLAGVPIAVKDNVPVAGEPMRDGSAATSSRPQPADHPVVARLRAAGAVVVGTTAVPELCVFGATDSVFGITRNPWRTSRTPGGSSGGSAAAVAAGMVPVAHGNDGMGSIRIPAACCGLVGLKPGTGVVPAELGTNDWYGMSENGPIATTAADTALLLSVMADQPGLAGPTEPDRHLAVAVSTKPPLPWLRVDREFSGATFAVATVLARAGHEVVRQDPPFPVLLRAAAFARWFAGTADDADELDDARLEPRVRTHARLGRITRRTPLVGDGVRAPGRDALAEFLAAYDVIVTPGLAQPPIEAARWGETSWWTSINASAGFAPFGAAWNVTGFPSVAIPAGIHESLGVPLSVVVTAAPGREALLLGLAAQLERLMPWPRFAPGH